MKFQSKNIKMWPDQRDIFRFRKLKVIGGLKGHNQHFVSHLEMK